MLKHNRIIVGSLFISLLAVAVSRARAGSVDLADLGFDELRQDYGKPGANKSVDGNPLIIGGKSFEHGVGSHALSLWWIELDGAAEQFKASVGMDDEVKSSANSKKTSIEFCVYGDRKTIWRSGKMKVGQPAKEVVLDLQGIKNLVLVIEPTGHDISYAHGDWADATITYNGKKPKPIETPVEAAEVLTPKAPPTPRINGAMLLGVRPGHPVLYKIAATGDRPMSFSAEGLPDGLKLDSETGQISGTLASAGKYVVTLKAANALGAAERKLQLEVGQNVALTPPMGWNSWNCFATAVSDEKVRAAADAMVSSGLINHGWTYINIDDCWEVKDSEPEDARRNSDGSIRTNEKFPDMKALADYIHSKGLRAGLYSSPGPSTCGHYSASYQHEADDALQYAAWGFDYLKYDWCSYGKIYEQLRKQKDAPSDLNLSEQPYALMHDELLKQNRDIVFSLCQYGKENVWEWGQQVGGNCWRTTGDISDNWSSMSGIGFNQAGHEKYAGPGHWNDPDMLVVGKVGWGPQLHLTHLTPNEQYTHISLWCLLSAPLLIGCDMTQLDDFTYGLLSNDEVLAVDQDPIGKQASRVADDEELEVWAKDLADGTKAVGLFNRGELPSRVAAKWDQLGLNGRQPVRDLWRQKDLGVFADQFSAEIPRHGVLLLKVCAERIVENALRILSAFRCCDSSFNAARPPLGRGAGGRFVELRLPCRPVQVGGWHDVCRDRRVERFSAD